MTFRTPPSSAATRWQWPGDLHQPARPLTGDFYSKLPPGPPYYQLIEGNLVLQWYTGKEDLRRPPQPVTADLFQQIPEGPPYYELIEGIIVMSPSPSFYHQTLLMRLSQGILNYLDEHPLGVAVVSPCDVRLEENTIFHPDLFFVRNGNSRVAIDKIVEGPPDLVVEILSPSNLHQDRSVKKLAYARSGVEEMWIIDPEARQVEVYALQQNFDVPAALTREPEPFHPVFFPGLAIDTVRLFRSSI